MEQTKIKFEWTKTSEKKTKRLKHLPNAINRKS